ncbi:MAG TPA: heavy metal-associated domain-containing protein [Candidatus Methylomirabilis sp.]|nr:heavy metal-associated domain-containing protein [Candidatus Methylomirabilis sp.]
MKRALEGLPGANKAEVSLTRERATVDFDPCILSPTRMIQAVRHTVVLPAARRAIQRATRPRSRASRD